MEGEAAYMKFISQFFFDMFVKGAEVDEVEGEGGDVLGKKRGIEEVAEEATGVVKEVAENEEVKRSTKTSIPDWVVDALSAVHINITALVRDREEEEKKI
ncbi:hypothetical protein EON65_09925 [archaeon]|nr:MAG: hypothetical protein EON65_09925 [archaeon]